MNCGYKEKIVLYFYGELAENEAADVQAHIRTCSCCSCDILVLRSLASGFDSFKPQAPDLNAEGLMVASRGVTMAEILSVWFRRGAMAATFTTVLLISFVTVGGRYQQAGWTGPDTALDDVEYGIYNLSEEITSSADFDYEYADIETRKELV